MVRLVAGMSVCLMMACASQARERAAQSVSPSVHTVAVAEVADAHVEAAADMRRVGPLDSLRVSASPSWQEMQNAWSEAKQKMLTSVQIDEDLQLIRRTLTAQEFMPYFTFQVAPLQRMVSYDVGTLQDSFNATDAITPVCARLETARFHCVIDRKTVGDAPLLNANGVYEFSVRDNGLATLVFHTFAAHDDPAWNALAHDARWQNVKGLLVDLRDARGNDPRTVMPWLEAVTHRAPLRPLRAVERVIGSEEPIERYRAQYDVHARDVDVWRGLVGTTPPATAPVTLPITVLLGPTCEAACELTARVLETHAHASVYGHTLRTAGLAWDQPAMLKLPQSRIEIFVYGYRYRLDEEIERVTGMTEMWNHPRDPQDVDIGAAALMELEQRVRTGREWPPLCTSVASYERRMNALPAESRDRVHGLSFLRGHTGNEVNLELRSALVPSAMKRLVESCSMGAIVRSNGPGMHTIDTHGGSSWEAIVSRLAQLDVVDGIYVVFDDPPPEPTQ